MEQGQRIGKLLASSRLVERRGGRRLTNHQGEDIFDKEGEQGGKRPMPLSK